MPRGGTVVPLKHANVDLDAMVTGVVAGDIGATRLLFEQFGPMVNRLVWRLLGADRDHNDVVHDVFVGVLSSIGTLKSPALLEHWMYSVAVNTVRREINKRRLRRIFHLDPDAGAGCPVPFDPEIHLAIKHFYEVMGGMGADDRIVFILRFVEGRRLAEIGSMLGCSITEVKRRLARAQAEYRKRAEGDPIVTWLGEERPHE